MLVVNHLNCGSIGVSMSFTVVRRRLTYKSAIRETTKYKLHWVVDSQLLRHANWFIKYVYSLLLDIRAKIKQCCAVKLGETHY